MLANPAAASGRGMAAAEAVMAQLEGWDATAELLIPSSTAAISPTVAHAVAGGMELLLVVGGDGLLHHALPALVDTDVVVGVVASGTGNDFATALGLPVKRSEAIAIATTDQAHLIRPVDLVRADVLPGVAPVGVDVRAESEQMPIVATSGWAATVVTGGFSGRVNRRADRLRFPRGSSRYTVATLRELVRLESSPVTVTVDGGTPVTIHASMFAVANTAYFGGGMAICPTASPFDGKLDLTVVAKTSAVTLARVLPTVFSGRHVDHKAVSTFRGHRIRLDTTEALWADGEPFLAAPSTDGSTVANPLSVLFSAEPAAFDVAGAGGCEQQV